MMVIFTCFFFLLVPLGHASGIQTAESGAADFAPSFVNQLEKSPFASEYFQARWLAARQKKALLEQIDRLPAKFNGLYGEHKKILNGPDFAEPAMADQFALRIIVSNTCGKCKGSVGLYWKLLGRGFSVDLVSAGKMQKQIGLHIKPKTLSSNERKSYSWRSLPALLVGSRKSKKVEVLHLPLQIEQIEKKLNSVAAK
jgi:hypothetical protein